MCVRVHGYEGGSIQSEKAMLGIICSVMSLRKKLVTPRVPAVV